MIGEQVVVSRRVQVGTDDLFEPVYEWQDETVDDVLVAPGPLADASDPQRPDGVRVVWQLHFPKGYPATLRGARVSVRGGAPLDVAGDPQPYTEANTPTRWSMPCELWRFDG